MTTFFAEQFPNWLFLDTTNNMESLPTQHLDTANVKNI